MWVCLCAKQCVSCTKLFCAIQSFEGLFGFCLTNENTALRGIQEPTAFSTPTAEVQKLDDVLKF
jgi:hypothetical protein